MTDDELKETCRDICRVWARRELVSPDEKAKGARDEILARVHTTPSLHFSEHYEGHGSMFMGMIHSPETGRIVSF